MFKLRLRFGGILRLTDISTELRSLIDPFREMTRKINLLEALVINKKGNNLYA